MKRFMLFAVVVAAPLIGGCRYRHAYVYHDDCNSPAVVRFQDDGSYSPRVPAHCHGPNCGHAWVDGCWVSTRTVYVEHRTYYGPHVVLASPVHHFSPFSWGRHFGPSVVIEHSHHCR